MIKGNGPTTSKEIAPRCNVNVIPDDDPEVSRGKQGKAVNPHPVPNPNLFRTEEPDGTVDSHILSHRCDAERQEFIMRIQMTSVGVHGKPSG